MAKSWNLEIIRLIFYYHNTVTDFQPMKLQEHIAWMPRGLRSGKHTQAHRSSKHWTLQWCQSDNEGWRGVEKVVGDIDLLRK